MTKSTDLFEWMSAARPDLLMKMKRDSGWLAQHAPEIDALYGVPQRADHHPEVDTGRHIELVLQVAAQLSSDPIVRWAALVHDLGKALTSKDQWPRHIDHEMLGVRPSIRMGRRLGVPRDWRLLGALVAKYHLRVHLAMTLSARSTVRLLRDVNLYDRQELLEPLLLACEADARGREGLQDRAYPQANRIREAFSVSRDITEASHGTEHHQARVSAVARLFKNAPAAGPVVI